MANTVLQIRRSSVAGRTPNTTTSTNTQYINQGELALNMADFKMFSSNGTVSFEIGANTSTKFVSNGTATGFTANSTGAYANIFYSNSHSVGNTTVNVQIGYANTSNTFWLEGGQGSVNAGLELILSNLSLGTNASGDFVIYDTTGIGNSNYIDMGINSNTWSSSSWTINGPSDGYLYTGNTNLSIGTQGANYINFFTGNTLAANERLRLAANGYIIIANASALVANGSVGTSGQVLTSNGTGLYWSTVSGGGGSVNTAAQYTFTNTITFSANVLITGNTTSELVVGNSTVYAIVNATSISGTSTNTTIVAGSFTTTFDTNGNLTAPNNIFGNTSITVGANLVINTTAIGVGNSTIYTNTTATGIISTGTVNAAVHAAGANLVINTTAIGVGNSTIYTNTTATGIKSISNTGVTVGTSNVSANGLSWLTNGVLLQWGSVSANSSSGNITFPNTFPVALFSFTVSPVSTTYSSTLATQILAANTSTANVRTGNATAVTVYWQAIGH